MKQKFIIVSFLIFSLLGAFALKAQTQPKDTVSFWIIADKTIVQYTKTGGVIKSRNDKVVEKILLSRVAKITKFVRSPKNARHRNYKSYSIYIRKEDVEPIRKWAKANL